MDILDRAAILAASDLEMKTVQTSEWGGNVAIRTFDGETRRRLLKPIEGGGMPDDWMERVVVASVCDKEGGPLFTGDDIKALSKKNAVVLERVFVAAIELNGLSEKSAEKIKGESKPTPK
jgi:hypothetical protein